ncbi:MAG: 23S rRNA (uracil(1939)-C(5))-methyltransferase RlmD [Verrucomicrobia bacterium]|nr:23S rRNA (uracil(1939)-C(5))-methyltransferase RlmD [Verrucomicrobiota bacterium]
MLLLSQPQTCCRHFGRCGGCTYQHLSYQEQLENKQIAIQQLFGQAEPIIGCDHPWQWRNKMEFSFSQNRAGDRFLGLMIKNSRGKVETLSECWIAQPWMVEVLQRVLTWWEQQSLQAYHPPTDRGALRTLTLREGIHTGEKMIVLTVCGHPEFALTEAQKSAFLEAVGPHTSVILRAQITARKTPTRFEQTLLYGTEFIQERLQNAKGESYLFKIRAASFFQPNTLQAQKLYQKALEPLHQEKVVLDLYCGTGTLGIFAAQFAEQVVSVELVPEAVEDAKSNMVTNCVQNMTVYQGAVEHYLDKLPAASTIILDPPRCGLSDQGVQELCSLKPKKIIYISCNPQTQKKNIDAMEGYRIVGVQPVDQFPHTPHMENIVFLESKV